MAYYNIVLYILRDCKSYRNKKVWYLASNKPKYQYIKYIFIFKIFYIFIYFAVRRSKTSLVKGLIT